MPSKTNMVPSYRKRSSPELEAPSSTFESKKDRENRPKSKIFGSFWQNLFRSTNATSPQPNPSAPPKTPEVSNNNIESLTDSAITPSSSLDSINTILSTHSFSFVSANKYHGKGRRGKRIPVTGHQDQDDPLVHKPPLSGRASSSKEPSTSAQGIRPQRKFGTLTRLGLKIGLKSKYNLQSCESLPRFGLDSTGNTMTRSAETMRVHDTAESPAINRVPIPIPEAPMVSAEIASLPPSEASYQPGTNTLKKRRAPPPPATTPPGTQRPLCSTRSIDDNPGPSTSSAISDVQRHRRAYSESSAGVKVVKSRRHVHGKRRAPVPPNPFGDPDALEDSGVPGNPFLEEDEFSVNENLKLKPNSSKSNASISKPGPSKAPSFTDNAPATVQKSQATQDELKSLEATMTTLQAHEKRINDEVRIQLDLLRKEASTTRSPATDTETNQTGTFLYAKAGKKEPPSNSESTSALPITVPSVSPVEERSKITPRPWYKRSPSKSGVKKTPMKPLTLLAKISEFDREAVRIIEEKRRRSAEQAYNQSANELITMFSSAFAPSAQVTGSPESSLAKAQASNSDSTASHLDVAAVPSASASTAVPKPETPQASACITATVPPQSSSSSVPASTPNDDQKKLAIVQPQSKPKVEPVPANAPSASTSGVSAFSERTPSTPYTRNPVQYFFQTSTSNGESEEWSCPRCTLKNPHWRVICEVCLFRKDSIGSYPPELVSDRLQANKQNASTKPVPVQTAGSAATVQTSGPPVAVQAAKPTAVQSARPATAVQTNKPAAMQAAQPDKTPTLPPGENFLSQLPAKNNLAMEQKLSGMKLFDDPEIEELDIQKLRQARLAFFSKNEAETENSKSNFKPNNLNPAIGNPIPDEKPTNTNVFEDEYETIDAVARLHQQLNPNTSGSGPGTWKPLHVHRFQPMLDSIRESTNSENYYEVLQKRVNPIYENWKFKLSELEEENRPWTRSFMQNVQMEIKDQIRYFDSLNPQYDSEDFLSDSDSGYRNTNGMDKQEFTVDDYRRMGAIPKHLRRNSDQHLSNGHSSSSSSNDYRRQRLQASEYQNETFAISKLLRKLESAISRGDHKLAASLAHDLALRKVNCVVAANDKPLTIRVYVEDRLMQQGPFMVQVTPSMKVKGLKAKIECDWGIPAGFQKWILGRKIAEDDEQALSQFDVAHDSMAFLYLVTPNYDQDSQVQQQSGESSRKQVVNDISDARRQPEISRTQPQEPNRVSKSSKPAKPSATNGDYQNSPPIPRHKSASVKHSESFDNYESKPSKTPELKPSEAKIHSPLSFSPEPVKISPAPLAKPRQARKVTEKVSRGTGTVLDIPATVVDAGFVPVLLSESKLPDKIQEQQPAKIEKESGPIAANKVISPVPLPRSTVPVTATNGGKVAASSSQSPAAKQGSDSPQVSKSNVVSGKNTEVLNSRVNSPKQGSPVLEFASKETPKLALTRPIASPTSPKQRNSPNLRRSSSPTLVLFRRNVGTEHRNSPVLAPPVIEIKTARINVIEQVPKVIPKSVSPVPNSENIQSEVARPIIQPEVLSIVTPTVTQPAVQAKVFQATAFTPEVVQSNSKTETAPAVQNPVMVTPKPMMPPVLLRAARRRSDGDYFGQHTRPLRHEMNPGKLSETIQKYEALKNGDGGGRESSPFNRFRSNLPTDGKSKAANSRFLLTRKNSDGIDINLRVTVEGMTNGVAAAGASGVAEKKEGNVQTYLNMLHLMEKEDLVATAEDVECPVCLSKQPCITLRDCLHSFCRECLVGAIQYSDESQVKCPFRDDAYSCDSFLQEREIKALVPNEMFEKLLAKSMKMAESRMKNAYHCKTNDCPGWCIFEDDVNVFNCPVCSKRNCLTCQAIHTGKDCMEYQRQLLIDAETDQDAKSSRLMLEQMIKRGEALECPACHVVLLKKWGCDFVKCTYCKTEICWITKGFRWGPNGKGDTSGGCRCGVNGIRCHPKCTYCH